MLGNNVALLFVVLLISCTKPVDNEEPMQEVTGKYALELEKTACESANKAGNCDRLASLGFVTREQCCDDYSKCC
jgi:hypothetical protein